MLQKLTIILIVWLLTTSLGFWIDHQYLQSLPARDQYKINLIQQVTPSVVSVIWLAPVYTYTYKYLDLWNWFYIKIPDKIVKQWYKIVTAWTAFLLPQIEYF